MTGAFAAIVEYAERIGVNNVKDMPGCWEVQVDARWWFALNGHAEPLKVMRNGVDHEVPPYHVYVEYNGWPAGIFNPHGGEFAAGAGANEDTFIAALQAPAPDVRT